MEGKDPARANATFSLGGESPSEASAWLASFGDHVADEPVLEVRFSEGMTLSVVMGSVIRLTKRFGVGVHELSIFFGYEWSIVPPSTEERLTSREITREALTS